MFGWRIRSWKERESWEVIELKSVAWTKLRFSRSLGPTEGVWSVDGLDHEGARKVRSNRSKEHGVDKVETLKKLRTYGKSMECSYLKMAVEGALHSIAMFILSFESCFLLSIALSDSSFWAFFGAFLFGILY